MNIFNDFMKQQFPVDAHTGDRTHPNHPDYEEEDEPEIEEVVNILAKRYTKDIYKSFSSQKYKSMEEIIKINLESLFNEIADYDEELLRKLI